MKEKIRKLLTEQKQMSESLILSLLLGVSGGFQDAYTYIVRNHVFANAQTGNIVLMSTNFLNGDWQKGLRYLFPILAFVSGVFIAERIGYYFHNSHIIHWRQGIIIFEILIMIIVGFLPQKFNVLCNIMISFSCAMQVQTFRTVGGNIYSSTMCIGNLRSGTEALSNYIRTKDKHEKKLVIDYFGVILFFALGAGVGGNLSEVLGEKTIWFSPAVLLLCFFLMELDRKSKHKKQHNV